MSDPYTLRAAHLLWVLALVYSIVTAILLLGFTALQFDANGPVRFPVELLALAGIAALFIAVHFLAARALRQYRRRWLALLLTVLSAFNFPVGTFLAAFIAYNLVCGWNEESEEEEVEPERTARGRVAPSLGPTMPRL